MLLMDGDLIAWSSSLLRNMGTFAGSGIWRVAERRDVHVVEYCKSLSMSFHLDERSIPYQTPALML